MSALLPDADRWQAFNEEIGDTYRKDGVFPAMQKFGEGTGPGGGEPQGETTPEAMEVTARIMGDLGLFAGRPPAPAWRCCRCPSRVAWQPTAASRSAPTAL